MLEFHNNQGAISQNPWWKSGAIPDRVRRYSPRPFLHDLVSLVRTGDNSPVLLAGPVGAGKTVLLLQLIQQLLSNGVAPGRIVRICLDLPVHTTADLAAMVAAAVESSKSGGQGGHFIIIDGAEVLENWEEQIRALAVANPEWRIISSTSMAPLFGKNKKRGRTRANERDSEKASGGIFASIILPPIMFGEFITFQNLREKVFDAYGKLQDTDALNGAFIDYVNWGGFIETVMLASPERVDMASLAASGIYGAGASIYGIGNVGELSRLYAYLAQGTAGEFSMEGLANEFSIAKNTIRKYLDYLEASFLIRRVWRLDENAKKFSRQTTFKIYLINPSHRAALFGSASIGDDITARVAETAVIAQFIYTKSISRLFYARWKSGNDEHHVSLVEMPPAGNRPVKCIEIDWSDRALALPQKALRSMTQFMNQTNPSTPSKVLTRTIPGKRFVGEHEIGFLPVAVWCWAIGKAVVDRKA